MELEINIIEKGTNYRKGILTINGRTIMSTLEPQDKGLQITDSLDIINHIKSQGKCAIPYGRYKLKQYFSPRFNKKVPLLLNVPGFEFVEIHTGNEVKDTEGCILVGINDQQGKDWISYSSTMFRILMDYINNAANEDIYLTLDDFTTIPKK